ncbi:MAG: hypothetical protein A2Y57_04100 [Candidatus Woykebacteria bacterium RBG_13_40_7b]|uniref:Uncharacterized protein n=1 Tax=Candidatus Woykebacteria bacterium RBG_13_40_7b TaxID=1802594 RepID=A0A1G1W9S5_9BACT|nr:MAG: hypothetical protein A2Y57_04100 [Candidatus Woykebacteria bacterium RBG_13_40_7b]
MESLKEIIRAKYERSGSAVYAKHEFQEYGIRLAENLHDHKHKTLYIKLAKSRPRKFLEEARAFAIDYKTQSPNRGKLFMWKLAELEKELKEESEKL